MSAELGEFDRRLLRALVQGVPLVPRPFDRLAEMLGATPAQVLARVAEWTAPGGIVRDIAGSFELSALGYETTLVGARVAAEALDEAGTLVAGHPGVSHCYGRDGPLNLWFTLAVGPGSLLGLERTVRLLCRMARAERAVSLPLRRRYKLRMWPAVCGEAPAGRWGPEVVRSDAPAPAGEQCRAVQALCRPLPADPEPFGELAGLVGMDAGELLAHAARFLAIGWMRRYGAVLRHRSAGAVANVLVAWRVPIGRADAFGMAAAGLEEVSHCFLREAVEDWPYNLYTMVHGADAGEVQRTIEAIAAVGGDYPRLALPTVREYKKARLQLFSREFRRWEAAVLG